MTCDADTLQEQRWTKCEARLRREVSKAWAAEQALERKLGTNLLLHGLLCFSRMRRARALPCACEGMPPLHPHLSDHARAHTNTHSHANTELLEEVGTALLRQYDGGEGPSCTIYSSAVPEGPAGAAEVGAQAQRARRHAFFVASTAWPDGVPDSQRLQCMRPTAGQPRLQGLAQAATRIRRRRGRGVAAVSRRQTRCTRLRAARHAECQ